MRNKLIAATAGIAAALAVAGTAHADLATRLHEGMQTVGQDVLAGTYHTAGPGSDDYGVCFITWLPYKGAKSTEATAIESYTGESYVRLKDGDVIDVLGCSWTHE